MNKFKFTGDQRKALILVGLSEFPLDKTEVFLHETEQIIGEWLTDYPTSSGDNKKSRESIEKLATQIDKAVGAERNVTSCTD